MSSSQVECPVCGREITQTSYQDDIWGGLTTVETHAKCPSGHYSSDYAYGNYEIKVGDQSWKWGTHDSVERDYEIHVEIDAAITALKQEPC